MRDLDLTTLRYLVAVCDLQNIARAAEQEHIAPSAISKRLASLEATLGVSLLIRTRRGVVPTPACEALLERARTILFEAAQIESEMNAFGGGLQGQVRLLASPSAIAERLLDDVASFMREPGNKGIRINIEEHFTRDIPRVLRDGSNGIGICWDTADLRGLQHQAYRTDDLMLAVPSTHALAQRKSLRFEQTLDFEHVGLQASSSVNLALQRAAARLGRTVNYRVVVSNFDAAFRVVAADLAITIIPAQVGSPHVESGLVKLIPLSDAWARRRFAICYRKVEELQAAGKRIVQYLASRAGRD
jgi:DNA-binding transcriptional LysR family regulator